MHRSGLVYRHTVLSIQSWSWIWIKLWTCIDAVYCKTNYIVICSYFLSTWITGNWTLRLQWWKWRKNQTCSCLRLVFLCILRLQYTVMGSMRTLNSHTILQNYPLLCCCHVMYRCTDTSASRHFGTGAEVSVGHFGTDHRGSHACRRRQLRSGRGGELKAVDAFSELWVLKSAQWCNRAIATSVENASCDYNYCYGVNVQGPLSCRLHSACVHHLNKSNYRM